MAFKYINPGFAKLGNVYDNFTDSTSTTYSRSGVYIYQRNAYLSSFDVDIPAENNETDIYTSFDYYVYSATNTSNVFYISFYDQNGEDIVRFGNPSTGSTIHDSLDSCLYTGSNTLIYQYQPKIPHYRTRVNLELHFKTGDDSCFEVWKDNVLWFSYKPSDEGKSNFTGTICGVRWNYGLSNGTMGAYLSSIFIQNERVSMRELKKLTVSPSSNQTIQAGNSKDFTISGTSSLSDSDIIKGLAFVVTSTNNDSYISQGELKFNTAKVGDLDLQSSEENMRTMFVLQSNLTKNDIEGKIANLSVNNLSN